MSAYLRFALALLAGVVIGILAMNAIQHFFPFAPPEGVDYASGKPFNAWVGSLSQHEHELMLMSFLVAALVGGLVTRLVAPLPAPFPLELIVGFILLFYSIVSYQAAPTPAWLTYISCPGCMLLAWIGGLAGRQLRRNF
ncbi:MAG: hypothetical protein ABIO24_06745 [Saprospiraceae bacterium]